MGKVDSETVFANYQPITSKTFVVSLLVEFIGVMIFTFLGSSVTDKVHGPWVNGLALAIWIYTAANISGCFDKTTISPDISMGQLFGWEVVMTFTLISVVYACGVAKPGHGSFTPLAVGLSLVACAGTGGGWTGAALNPARVIGPLAVFKCGTDIAWIYILAQLLASVLACSIFAFVSGWGPLMPLTSTKNLGLSFPEAVWMWATGSPPKRFQHSGDENITDVMEDAKIAKKALDSRKQKGLDAPDV